MDVNNSTELLCQSTAHASKEHRPELHATEVVACFLNAKSVLSCPDLQLVSWHLFKRYWWLACS